MSRRQFLAASAFAAAAKAASPDTTWLTLKRAGELLRSRSVSPLDLTEACLKRIEQLNPKLNAFITVTAEQARKDAQAIANEQRQGKWRGPLHGIPIAIKDNIDTAGVRTTGASELFRDRVPAEDAEVVRRLKAAGAIFLGKLNLVEFAYGGNPASTAYGTVHNPWSLDHSPGGSSSGPGAAVAAGLCFGALGTDTAGSIRGPASNCGLAGLKPTYGRVSMRGVIPLSWPLDHVGPLTRSAEDAALMLQAIAGYDPQDPTTADAPVPNYASAVRQPAGKLRLARPAALYEGLDAEVGKAVDTALEVLRKMTAGVRDVSLPASGTPAQVWGPEAYLYHSKWITETPEKYQPSTRRSLEGSANAKTSEYVQARLQVDALRRQIRSVFRDVDLLVLPTSVNPPGKIGDNAPPGRNNNVPFDVFGLPAISVPCGYTASGLPIGLQIVGAPFAEGTVLSLACAYQRATDWHTRHPASL